MGRDEFDQLWKAQKSIVDDIEFVRDDDSLHNFVFSEVIVHGTEAAFVLNGHYDCLTGYFSVNFIIPGVGPVHRYDLGGDRHHSAGRYHEHRIETLHCARRNLPFALERSDLEGLTPSEAWQKICAEASIVHTGSFFPPEVLCS